jgi:HAD superfamily hydrolase (TIGR01509 family)
MLRVIILDFDGIVADSEPAHLAMFQRVLGEIGIFLSAEEYYANYLGYDDRGCFQTALLAKGRPADDDTVQELVRRKAQAYLTYVQQNLRIYPGVKEFVAAAAKRYPLAIASGALRQEIEWILQEAGLRRAFVHITSAEDVTKGKPDPEIFLHALAGINRRAGGGPLPITPEDCLVVEDSIPGIRGAHAAGMKVLAVANTHKIDELQEADEVINSLERVRLPELEQKLWALPSPQP